MCVCVGFSNKLDSTSIYHKTYFCTSVKISSFYQNSEFTKEPFAEDWLIFIDRTNDEQKIFKLWEKNYKFILQGCTQIESLKMFEVS